MRIGFLLPVCCVAAAASVPAQQAPAGPGPRTSHAMVYHDGLQRVVMLTGDRGASKEAIWAWDGSRWTPIAAEGPPARGQSTAVFDSVRQVLIMQGGAPGLVSFGDTWEWSGGQWALRGESLLRDHHAMAFDQHRGRTVLFGGLRRPTQARDSWEWISDVSEWDGHTWHTVSAAGPGARVSPGLTYDAARRHVLLFGGGDQSATSLGDTWTWDGARWAQASTEGPEPRRAHAMTFDPVRGVVLLFGGTNGTTFFDDLWQWDGTRWTRTPATTPSPGKRFGAAMAYDAARRTLVLHGGFQDGRIMDDTWEWSGGSWSLRGRPSGPPLQAPPPAASPAPVHGSTREVITLAPGVYEVAWTAAPGFPEMGNSVFIVNDTDVVVVDTGFTRQSAEAVIAEIRRLTSHPVSLIVNTHWHADHNAGNELFVETFPGVEIIGHPETTKGLLESIEPYNTRTRPEVIKKLAALDAAPPTATTARERAGLLWQRDATSVKVVPPTMSVTDSLVIARGSRRIEVRYLGTANTKGDLVVYLPNERIVISGDLALTPVQFAFQSSPSAWVQTLDRLATIGATTWVPGHGPAQRDPEFIRDLQDLLRSVVTQVTAGIKAGRSLAELTASVTVTPRPGSVYTKINSRAFDALFRIPAIESAFVELSGKG